MYCSAALRKEEYYTCAFEIASLPHFYNIKRSLQTTNNFFILSSLWQFNLLFVGMLFFFSWQASPTDEAIALLLFEWAVSKYRVGKFRALAVAKILQRRQTELVEEVRLLIRVLRLWVQFFFCSTQK